MADVKVVDAHAREARGHVRAVLLLLEDERQEALDRARGNIVAVRPLDQRLQAQGELGPIADG